MILCLIAPLSAQLYKLKGSFSSCKHALFLSKCSKNCQRHRKLKGNSSHDAIQADATSKEVSFLLPPSKVDILFWGSEKLSVPWRQEGTWVPSLSETLHISFNPHIHWVVSFSFHSRATRGSGNGCLQLGLHSHTESISLKPWLHSQMQPCHR